MGKSLGMSDGEYQWLLTIFYIPYITFEWLALMWKLIPPHIWAFITVLTWYAALSIPFNLPKLICLTGALLLPFRRRHLTGLA
jgi:hypothetical protein